MARAKKEMPAAEKSLSDKLANFAKIDKPSDKQKADAAEWRKELGSLRFKRIANKRVPRTIKAIQGIGSLASKSYTKSEAQIKHICDALRGAVATVERQLTGAKTSEGFTLPE